MVGICSGHVYVPVIFNVFSSDFSKPIEFDGIKIPGYNDGRHPCRTPFGKNEHVRKVFQMFFFVSNVVRSLWVIQTR
jgi:hypothetical protein